MTKVKKIFFVVLSLFVIGFGVRYKIYFTSQLPTQKLETANYCKQNPKFITSLDFSKESFLTTSLLRRDGLFLVGQSSSGEQKIFQHSSWKEQGNLGGFVLDEEGNIYVFPVPMINLINNPPEKQNIIYRVDSKTGIMSEWLKLPKNNNNKKQPFGILGLVYDCNLRALFASTVYDSEINNEKGKIYKIELKSKIPTEVINGTDVFGLVTFKSGNDYGILYGLARNSRVYYQKINRQGMPIGKVELFFNLETLPNVQDDKPKKISINSNNEVVVRGLEFDFNLIAPTDIVNRDYYFELSDKRQWKFKNFKFEN